MRITSGVPRKADGVIKIRLALSVKSVIGDDVCL